MTQTNFYFDLEANFRGTREEILERLKFYLPFIEPLFANVVKPQFMDLGCGRGEWLELIETMNGVGFGVDLDEGMLKDCYARELNAQKIDAIDALKGLKDNSQAVVSGFHIAEHLPFDTLLEIIEEAHRVLIPGGLLILETPNAENLNVGALTFYFDPTHNKPLPPGLLSYLPRRVGFIRSLVVRLQENPQLRNSETVNLIDVLHGVSPDYAVIAQKFAPNEVLNSFDDAFNTDYGLTIDTLAHRFENSIDAKLQKLNEKIDELDDKLNYSIVQSHDYRDQIQAMKQSYSWRVTLPLRYLKKILSGLERQLANLVIWLKRLANRLIKFSIRFVLHRPLLRRYAKQLLKKFPNLRDWLLKIFLGDEAKFDKKLVSSIRFKDLSPRAEQYYKKLKQK